ncbi:MAG: glycosyltransferase family 2 protein [Lachnospiraceae bacterium]|nr:glycosyltransferase family 2 protein [Lachnospiraceae bacterium]
MKISFVIPCYRSENTLSSVIEEIENKMKTMSGYDHEIILVNDCSPDRTFEVIKDIASKHDNVKGLSLSKNFGQHSALMAGFHYVTGDIVVCLDDDGQTPADEADKLISAVEAGADVAYARYAHKKHSFFRNFGSRVNDRMTRIMLGKPKDLHISSYFAAKRFVIDEITKYTYAFPYVMGLVLRTTKNIVNVDVNHRNRTVGESGYTFGKLMSLWFNGFTAFSIKPLRLATGAGITFAVVGFVYGIYTIIKKIFIQPPELVTGFSALMSAVVFIGGMLMLMLGLVGEYLGRVYISMNNSPQYVICEKTGAFEQTEVADEH